MQNQYQLTIKICINAKGYVTYVLSYKCKFYASQTLNSTKHQIF